MACFYPLQAYRSPFEGGRIVFNAPDGSIGTHANIRIFGLKLPCGQCTGCLIDRSRNWSIRCVHEAQLHRENSFITLTYSDEFLPADGSLNLRHVQLFLKRLRKKFTGVKIRFFCCGEYGPKLGRPHYHLILFGLDFDDKILFKKSKSGNLYTSQILSNCWGKGYVTTGSVTLQSAAYVARYCLKKINGQMADSHYLKIDSDTGECSKVKPEFATMSRRPGIASDWFKKYSGDVYPKDFVTVDGKKYRPPKYYDKLFEAINPDEYEWIKDARVDQSLDFELENTPERLAVKDVCLKSKVKKLIRHYEDGSSIFSSPS